MNESRTLRYLIALQLWIGHTIDSIILETRGPAAKGSKLVAGKGKGPACRARWVNCVTSDVFNIPSFVNVGGIILSQYVQVMSVRRQKNDTPSYPSRLTIACGDACNFWNINSKWHTYIKSSLCNNLWSSLCGHEYKFFHLIEHCVQKMLEMLLYEWGPLQCLRAIDRA